MKSKSGKISGVLTGVAGEYFVAAELSRMGYLAAITLRNSKGVDIIATNSNATRSVAIQVKSAQGSQRRWLLNEKAENYHARNLFYVFVSLNNGAGRPSFHIVPSVVVVERVKTDHQMWLKTPGRGGRKHKDSAIRGFEDLKGKYLEKWNLLKL
jgi:hypothetical protein